MRFRRPSKKTTSAIKATSDVLVDASKGLLGAEAKQKFADDFSQQFVDSVAGILAVEFVKAGSGMVGKALIGVLLACTDSTVDRLRELES